MVRLLRPAGYGVLTTTGRKTGKARRKCVRAIKDGDRVYLVAIPGGHAAWLKNIRAQPTVCVRIRGRTYNGIARELVDPAEIKSARRVYRKQVHACDYLTCALHRRGLPTKAKAAELINTFFEQGIPLVIDLETR